MDEEEKRFAIGSIVTLVFSCYFSACDFWRLFLKSPEHVAADSRLSRRLIVSSFAEPLVLAHRIIHQKFQFLQECAPLFEAPTPQPETSSFADCQGQPEAEVIFRREHSRPRPVDCVRRQHGEGHNIQADPLCAHMQDSPEETKGTRGS